MPKTTLLREIRRAIYGVVFATVGFVIATELLYPGQPLSLNRGALPAAIIGGLIGGFGVDWLLPAATPGISNYGLRKSRKHNSGLRNAARQLYICRRDRNA